MVDYTIDSIFSQSWEIFKKRLGTIILFALGMLGVLIAYAILSSIVLGVLVSIFENSDAMVTIISLLSGIVNFFIQLIFGMVGIKFLLDLVDGKEIKVKELLPVSFMQVLSFLGAAILVGLMTFAGMIALIIPGIIVILALFFVNFLILDKNMGAIEAIKASFEATKGTWMKMFLLGLLFSLLVMVSAIPLGLGLFITVPMMYIAQAVLYRTYFPKTK